LNRAALLSTYGNPQSMSDQTRRQQLPGRVPFIIPPTATKSAYYRTPLTRELWQTARQALRAADHLSILGYSLPPGDIVMSGMLESAIRGQDVLIDIADLDPTGPRDRLVALGASPQAVTTFEGPNSVPELTKRWLGTAAKELVDSLKSTNLGDHADDSLLVAWANPIGEGIGATRTARVAKLSRPGPAGEVELLLDQHEPIGGATAVRVGPDGLPTNDVWPTTSDLVSALAQAERIVVRKDNGDLATIIDTSYESREIGANPRWLALVPAGRQSSQRTEG
jgi:hypothetical protein